ncbi:head fiber protein, partial [Bifidobacterium aerophilum]|uniref:head fiber protein n=1 Tax=Bifidobacterium aerophilum TaxID=1798155 RepID=UPI0030845105
MTNDARQAVIETQFLDADGNPVDLGGAPAAGSITNAMLAGGITKDKLAAGVIPAAYTLPAATTTALGGVKKGGAVGT